MFSWYLFVSLVFSHLGFWSGNLFLIAPFPDICLLVPFYEYIYQANEGCMTCRKLEKLERGMPLPLQRGDHIQMPLGQPCLGRCLSHHAIVIDCSESDGNLTVIDIPDNGGMFKKKLIIGANSDVDIEQITRIDYRKRKYTHLETYNRALKFISNQPQNSEQNVDTHPVQNFEFNTDMNTEQNSEHNAKVDQCCSCNVKCYNLFYRNCEHFAAACVNGQEDLSPVNIDESTSLQTVKCCWLTFDIVLAVIQFLLFITNFYIYAVYVQEKVQYNHFPDWLTKAIEGLKCYGSDREYPFIEDCDWKAIVFFFVLYVIVFVVLFVYQYCYLKNTTYCMQ